ncbi:MAG: peptidoglycan-associated lipoprotein Pal [Elusimicrobia bacterium]|nr:peptidoglycan-associated lipoprotein Pal [Elusimicrobiota bacterium]
MKGIRQLFYLSAFSLMALWLVTSGCAKKSLVKKDAQRTQEKIASRSGEDEEEASLRGKEYRKTPELETVRFDFDKAELSSRARDIIHRNAAWIKSRPDAEIKIEGHCDERGTTEYNLGLGTRRARVVRDYYKSLGVRMKKMSTLSYGEEKPVCEEPEESCWTQNRRAETLVRLPPRS